MVFAAFRNDLEVARLLLDRHADTDPPNVEANTALMDASAEGHLGIVLLLLERGANKKAVNREGKTALDLASSNQIRDALK